MPYQHMDTEQLETPKGDDVPAKQYLVRRSKKLPKWLWIAIAQSLGIKIRQSDRTILATILYSLTVISALALVGSTVTFVTAGIIQSRNGSIKIPSSSLTINISNTAALHHVHNDVIIDGIVMVALTSFWCLLGLYSKNLAYRLYHSAKFLAMVRLHAKTILKVNSAFVFFLLLSTFVSVNIIQAYYIYWLDTATCVSVGISSIVCQVRFVSMCVFSLFAILWNSLVGMVLLSVCRTNTMGIRRFIQALEKDALIYEQQNFGSNASANDLMWLADGNDADASSEGEVEPKLRHRYSNNPPPTIRLNNNEHAVSVPEKSTTASAEAIAGPSFRSTMELRAVSPSILFCPSTVAYCTMEVNNQIQPMSTAVILQRFWKLSCTARLSSTTFQRWTSCVTTLCLAWVSIGLVQWLSNSPRPLQVAQVCIPLMILPLLCAAYAEVNAEGKRLLKCICPAEQRLNALYVMWQSPPQMNVFGTTITYGAMATAAAGLLLALISRVVLKQLGAGSS